LTAFGWFRIVAAVITSSPFSYSSFGYRVILSQMMKMLGLGHRFGSRPSVPAPRVTTTRRYESSRPLASRVSQMALAISAGVRGIERRMPRAESYSRRTWASSRNTFPPYERMPSKTPSPYRTP